MRFSNAPRRAARICAPLIAMALVTVVSCIDRPNAPSPHDDWAEGATVGLQLQGSARFFDFPGQPRLPIGPIASQAPVLRGFSAPSDGRQPVYSRSGNQRAVVRHFRHGRDSVTSIALTFASAGGPPKFIYVFENGHIQAIVSAVYALHGKGLVRSRARVTLFDGTGRVRSQADIGERTSSRAGAAAGARFAIATRALADVVALLGPRELAAEEIPESCLSLWISYVAASAGLAAASTVLTGAGAGCAGTGLTCPALVAAGLAWLYALDKWQIALDKLTDCIAASQASSPPSGVSGTISSESGATGTQDLSNLTKTVTDFIETAIESGNYWCSDDGNDCVYYAA